MESVVCIIILIGLLMRAKLKTKNIEKEVRKNKKKGAERDNDKNNGQPELKHLSDFVTALTPLYTSRPIYTGGRIVLTQGKLFAACNQDIAIYDLAMRSNLNKIKLVSLPLSRQMNKSSISQSIPRQPR